MTEKCGYEKDDGEPCELPASKDDGRCHHHTEIKGERANGGRPSKLDDHWDDIMAGARQGMALKGCARLAGVPEQTLHRWKNEHEDFRRELKRARAHGELKHLQSVNESGSRFLLERSFGYVKTEKHEVEADNTHKIEGDGFVVEFNE